VAFISNARGNEIVKYERIMQYINPSTLNVNDMAAIEDINEVDLLSNLKNRFFNKTIFTNVGSTLIVVNPYQTIQGVFGEEIMEKYLQVIFKLNNF
jgi:myosin heavy subunit